MKTLSLITLSLLLATTGSALPGSIHAGSPSATAIAASAAYAPDPARQALDVVRLLRNNDLGGALVASLPPQRYAELRAEFEEQRRKPISDAQRAEFEEKLARITAPDAVDSFMAELEPRLQQLGLQAEGGILMALGGLHMAVNSPQSDLTDEQRATLRQMLPGLERWIIGTSFFSRDSARSAITLLVDAARGTGVRSLDELRALPLEDALAHAGRIFGASKQALRVYGIDVDEILASARFEVLDIEGEKARIRAEVTVFGAPVAREHSLVLINGRWYSEDMVLRMQVGHRSDAADSVEREG